MQTAAEQREAAREGGKQVSSAGGICIPREKMSSLLRIISFNGSAGMRKISSSGTLPEWLHVAVITQLREERNLNHIKKNNNNNKTHFNSSFHS